MLHTIVFPSGEGRGKGVDGLHLSPDGNTLYFVTHSPNHTNMGYIYPVSLPGFEVNSPLYIPDTNDPYADLQSIEFSNNGTIAYIGVMSGVSSEETAPTLLKYTNLAGTLSYIGSVDIPNAERLWSMESLPTSPIPTLWLSVSSKLIVVDSNNPENIIQNIDDGLVGSPSTCTSPDGRTMVVTVWDSPYIYNPLTNQRNDSTVRLYDTSTLELLGTYESPGIAGKCSIGKSNEYVYIIYYWSSSPARHRQIVKLNLTQFNSNAVPIPTPTPSGRYSYYSRTPVYVYPPTPIPMPAYVATDDMRVETKVKEPLGGNLVRIFNFSNRAKTWSFYDPDPDLAGINTLQTVATGEVYWIKVYADAVVTLNNKPRQLYSGWNLVAY